jgi:hypothetical protein
MAIALVGRIVEEEFASPFAAEEANQDVVETLGVRSRLVEDGDLRNEIGFQNDINVMLALLDFGATPWESAAPMLSREWDDGRERWESGGEDRTTRRLVAVP